MTTSHRKVSVFLHTLTATTSPITEHYHSRGGYKGLLNGLRSHRQVETDKLNKGRGGSYQSLAETT